MTPPHTVRDGRKPGWFHIDNELIDRYGADAGAIGVAVYCALARYADRDGRAFPSYKRLSESLHIARNTLVAALRRLESMELITITAQTDSAGNPINTNIYTLLTIPQRKDVNERRGGAAVDQGGASPDPPHAAVDQGGASPDPRGSSAAYEEDSSKKTHGDGDGVRALESFLSSLPMFPKTIAQIMALHLDPPTVIAACTMLRDAGWGIGAIADHIRTYPPVKGQTYEQPERPEQRPAAPDNTRRPAARRTGNHSGPTGGAELHNPGWQQKELERIQKLYNIPDAEM